MKWENPFPPSLSLDDYKIVLQILILERMVENFIKVTKSTE